MISAREGNRVHRTVPLSEISLGIVCPMANEEPTAVTFVREVLAQCISPGFKSVTLFVILDQKSTDRTRELLGDLKDFGNNLSVIWSPENRCVVDAYLVGYRKALEAECDWILEMDAGFSHQPNDLAKFFTQMSQGYDCVFGSRFCPGGSMKESPLARQLISRGGTILSNLLLGTRLKDMTSGFELFTRQALQLVVNKGIRSRGPFFQTEIKAYCRNLHITEVPIQYRAASNKVGSSALKDSFSNLWRLFRLRLQNAL
jgi:dolichol-phosphate mannosyltransferase